MYFNHYFREYTHVAYRYNIVLVGFFASFFQKLQQIASPCRVLERKEGQVLSLYVTAEKGGEIYETIYFSRRCSASI